MSEIAKALLAFQKNAPALRRDTAGQHSKYLSLETLVEKVRPALNEQGLTFRQAPTIHETFPALRTTITHAESGEEIEDVMLLAVDKPGPQAQGSALTYGRRYSLMAMLGLVADDDDDGVAATAKPAARETTNSASNGQPPKITTAQGSRLWAIAKAKNVDREAVREMMKRIAGVESTKDIPLDKYDKLVAAVEVGNSSFYAPTGGGGQGDDIPFEPAI